MLKIDSVITNGYISIDTIEEFTKNGWVYVITFPASLVHPYAAPTDKISLFSKYEEVEVDNDYAEEIE